MFNATVNNISVILWQSVLLEQNTREHWKNALTFLKSLFNIFTKDFVSSASFYLWCTLESMITYKKIQDKFEFYHNYFYHSRVMFLHKCFESNRNNVWFQMIFWVTLTSIIFMWHDYPLANEVAKGYSNATVRPSVTSLWTL